MTHLRAVDTPTPTALTPDEATAEFHTQLREARDAFMQTQKALASTGLQHLVITTTPVNITDARIARANAAAVLDEARRLMDACTNIVDVYAQIGH